jgi:hypothetical protein
MCREENKKKNEIKKKQIPHFVRDDSVFSIPRPRSG